MADGAAADDVEFDLKMSTRKPLGPLLSADGLGAGASIVTPPRTEGGPAKVGGGDNTAAVAGYDVAAVCVAGPEFCGAAPEFCGAGAELCLTTSTRMPLGPDSSAYDSCRGTDMVTPPRAEAAPAESGT